MCLWQPSSSPPPFLSLSLLSRLLFSFYVWLSPKAARKLKRQQQRTTINKAHTRNNNNNDNKKSRFICRIPCNDVHSIRHNSAAIIASSFLSAIFFWLYFKSLFPFRLRQLNAICFTPPSPTLVLLRQLPNPSPLALWARTTFVCLSQQLKHVVYIGFRGAATLLKKISLPAFFFCLRFVKIITRSFEIFSLYFDFPSLILHSFSFLLFHTWLLPLHDNDVDGRVSIVFF